jgi:hypothetical protein
MILHGIRRPCIGYGTPSWLRMLLLQEEGAPQRCADNAAGISPVSTRGGLLGVGLRGTARRRVVN